MLRRVVPLLGLLLALSTATAGRAEDANQACANDQDVTIVVDFGSLDGGVNVRCASQPIKNGFDVFRRANVSYETVSGSDFVCRIAAKPGPEDEDCANTPPGDKYWTYWHAKPGGEWKYANVGPAGRKPPPGSYEGWSFKLGGTAQAPRYPVPAASSPPTTTATTTAPNAPGTDPNPPAAATPTTRPRGISATTVAGAPTTQSEVGSTTSSLPTEVALLPNSATTTIKLGTADLTVRSGDGGSSTGFIASIAALGGLGVGAFVFLRRRGR